jgi:hypothetical protein
MRRRRDECRSGEDGRVEHHLRGGEVLYAQFGHWSGRCARIDPARLAARRRTPRRGAGALVFGAVLLEADIALEAATVSSAGTRFERVLYYAENDAFLFDS